MNILFSLMVVIVIIYVCVNFVFAPAYSTTFKHWCYEDMNGYFVKKQGVSLTGEYIVCVDTNGNEINLVGI